MLILRNSRAIIISVVALPANDLTNEGIHDFAEAIGVGPGIVVGRLQFEGVLKPHQGNALKQKLNWQFAEDA